MEKLTARNQEDGKNTVLVIQGPNLNLLGEREKEIYGSDTLDSLHLKLDEQGKQLGVRMDFFQSNHEGGIVDRIQSARMEPVAGIIINAAGFTHTSVAIRDALLGVNLPFIEVHISNVYAREDFRHHSYLSDVSAGLIVGTGTAGYRLALLSLVSQLVHAGVLDVADPLG
ncbi:MAG: type II 3-dehydroquinate dehydratase [Leptospiraceae bacterium]|nr:type II 3-dehydroquinate dehydratase [Leptospiraceae bacterium]